MNFSIQARYVPLSCPLHRVAPANHGMVCSSWLLGPRRTRQVSAGCPVSAC